MSKPYYVVGHRVSDIEKEHNAVFSSADPAGAMAIDTFSSLGFEHSNTELRKVHSSLGELSEGEVSRDFQRLVDDIFVIEPEVIIALGSEVSAYLLGDKFVSIGRSRGRLYDVDLVDSSGEVRKFKVIPTYSFNYVVRNSSGMEYLYSDLSYAKSYVDGNLVDIESKDIRYALTYQDYLEFYNNHLANSDNLAFDLETNAEDPRSKSARIVGFSLAGDGDTGIYIVRNSLEYNMKPSDWDAIVHHCVENILKERTIVVHNSMFEVPSVLNEWDYYIDNFEDSLIKARLLLGGGTGAGLKGQCAANLGYPDWESDLQRYKSGFVDLLAVCRPSRSKQSEYYDILRDYTLDEAIDFCLEKDPDRLSADKKFNKFLDAILNISSVCSVYYTTDSEYREITRLVCDEILRLVNMNFYGEFSYGFVPLKVIVKYGALDSIATIDLNNFLDNQIAEYSDKLGINLMNGYKYLKEHFISGTWMEINGLLWNDEVAEGEKDWYSQECIKALTKMLDSPLMEDYIVSNLSWLLNDYIVENRLDIVQQATGANEISHTKSGIRLDGGPVIRYKNVVSELLGAEFVQKNRALILYLARNRARELEYYQDGKYLFNPSSTSPATKEFLNNIWVTEEIRFAYLFNKIRGLIEDPNFDLYKYPVSDRPIFQLVIDAENYNKMVKEAKIEGMTDKELYKDFSSAYFSEDSEDAGGLDLGVEISDKQLFKRFVEVFSSTSIMSRELQVLAGEALNYRLDSISEGCLIDLNRLYLISGIDIDDQSTWSDRYAFLVNFRIWKKCNKMITTYIDGNKVGRGSVWSVDKESYQRGDTITRRNRKYDKDHPIDTNKELYVMQPKYGVGTASSFRWRAGLHTLPAESSIKNIYTSRFDHGVIAAPDFSQMELIALAGASKCKPMLDAFARGADIHLENATKIFGKKAEDITPAERRYSKMACTLGSTKIKLANGTVRTIEDLYSSGMRDFYAYSYDTENGKIAPGHVVDVQLTKHTTDIMRVNLDNGTHIDVTPEHRFLTLEAGYVHARDLESGTKLESLFYRVPKSGAYSPNQTRGRGYEQIRDVRHEYHRKNKWTGDTHTRYGKWKMTHQEFYSDYYGESVGEGNNIDHIDMNSLNNDPVNLSKLSQIENAQKSWSKSDSDKFGLIAQASNIVKFLLNEKLEPTPSNFDQAMEHMYESRGHLYWETVSKYYSMSDIIERIAVESGFKHVEPKLFDDPIKGHFKLSEIACRRVLSVEKLELEEPVPVYDMSVEKHHNYAIDLGDNSGVFTHNSFMIVYGGDVNSFASEFLNGDLSLAKFIFDSFYSAYPEVKQYIEDKHNQVRQHGLVTTMMDMFINVDIDNYMNEAEAMRFAQNSPIQSAGCFSGDTRIKTLDGKNPTFKELVDSGTEEVWLYSRDSEMNIIPKLGIKPRITKYVTDIVEVELDNGEVIICTPDHRFMLKSGDYLEAENLETGTSLSPLYLKQYEGDRYYKKGEYTQYYNHKVVEVRRVKLDEPIPVYDISVPGTENFALDSGVFVHNSTMAGCVIYQLKKFIEEHNYKSKVILFIHDSIELDIHPDEMLAIGSQIIPLMNKFPMEEFGIPTKADLVLAKSLGQEVEITSIKCNEDYTVGDLVCEAEISDFEALINQWEGYYKSVTWEDIEEPEESVVSWSQLWISKKAIDRRGYGTKRIHVKRKVHIEV